MQLGLAATSRAASDSKSVCLLVEIGDVKTLAPYFRRKDSRESVKTKARCAVDSSGAGAVGFPSFA